VGGQVQVQGHGNGHAALFRIRLYEKTGRFEQS
jgi:hypothetical protein